MKDTHDAMLTPGQRSMLKARLELRLHQLQSSLREHHGGISRVEHARDMLTQDGDDAPQRAADREVDLALTNLEAREIDEVGLALRRIRDQNYGLCQKCGNAIAFDRLMVEPQATHCVSCLSSTESGRPYNRPP